MIKVSRNHWLKQVRNADIGLTLGNSSIFGKVQNLYRKKVSKVKHRASHGFFVKNFAKVSEANGKYVEESNLAKYLVKQRKTWLFRYQGITETEQIKMHIHMESAEVSGGTFSWTGIFQFVLKFIDRKKRIKDKPGVFCTEHTSRIINAAGLRYSTLGRVEPWKVTPSIQLSWFLTEGSELGWNLALYFDGTDYWMG